MIHEVENVVLWPNAWCWCVFKRFYTRVLFPGIVSIVPGILRSHQKDLELELFFGNIFTPFQSLLERWYFPGEEKVPISDWLGELQTTPRKTPKAILFAHISIISISIAHQRRETNLWQHKIKRGSGGVMRRCLRFWWFTRDFGWRFTATRRPREVVCGLQ